MLLNDFSGGQNIRVAPSLLGPTQAQIYSNIDNTSGSIKPIKGSTNLSIAVDKYFKWYNFGQEYLSSATETAYVEYQDIMYYTVLGSHPLKYNGTDTYRLGVVGPTLPLTVGLNTTGNLTGTYLYAYTYYSSTTGIESKPSNLSTEVVATADSILIDDIVPSIDPQIDSIRLYRIGGGLTDYTLVIEKANNADSYIDDNTDVSLAGNHLLDSWENGEAPEDIKYLFEAYGMLFGAISDKLYYTNIGEPNSWPEVNFIDFESNVTGVAQVQGGLIVFTRFKSYIITGSSPETFSKNLLDGEQGCISHYSINYTNNNLIWLSLDGICMTTGGLISVVSLPLAGELSLEGLNNAQVLGRAYYISYADGLLVFDFKYNTIMRTVSEDVEWLDVHDDILYGSKTSSVHSMFTGEVLNYHYKSPVLVDGSYTMRKDYKDFYIKYDGTIELKLFVDGNLVNYKELDGNSCYNLKALNSSSGYGLEIEIEGTGTVSEIEYKAAGRQNGR